MRIKLSRLPLPVEFYSESEIASMLKMEVTDEIRAELEGEITRRKESIEKAWEEYDNRD